MSQAVHPLCYGIGKAVLNSVEVLEMATNGDNIVSALVGRSFPMRLAGSEFPLMAREGEQESGVRVKPGSLDTKAVVSRS